MATRSEREQLAEALEALEHKRQAQLQLDREIVELRALLREAERQLSTIRRTLSYRLGTTLVNAKTFKARLLLPIALFKLWQVQRDRRLENTSRGQRPADALRFVEKAEEILRRDGFDAVLAHLIDIPDRQKREKARAMLEIAAQLRATDPDKAALLGVEAARVLPTEGRLRHLVFDLYDDGLVRGPAAILALVDASVFGSAAQLARAEAVRSDARELEQSLRLPETADAPASGETLAILSCRALPAHAEATTYRIAAIGSEAVGSGRKAVIITEPGYRYPAKGDGSPRRVSGVDGVDVIHLPKVEALSSSIEDWATEAAAAIGVQLAAENVGAMHMTSHNPLAMAGAMAARARGIPFTLDVGAIPFTGSPTDADSERMIAAWSRFETVARAADRVIVRSRAIGAALARRFPDLATEFVADTLPSIFVPSSKASQRDIRRELGISDDRPLLGVIIDSYFGDEARNLVRAMPEVRRRIPDAVMVVFGPGRFGQSVRREAAILGLGNAVLVPDGFARQRLAQYVSTFAAMAFPAVSNDATGLSVPFELQVALAMGKPVVAGDCDWASEWAKPGAKVAWAQCGDAGSYAEAIVTTLLESSKPADPA